MKEFAALIKALDSTNKTTLKVSALAEYFNAATDPDKVWAIAILSHRRPPRPVNTTLLREWASELADIPLWLFEESYHIVGDLAETIALVAPPGKDTVDKPLHEYLRDMIWLKARTEEEKKEYLLTHWTQMDYYQRFVFTKLITGGFRIGVSQKLMTRALSQSTGIEEDLLAYKLMGNWDPAEISFRELILEEKEGDRLSRPYPFYLAYALEDEISTLGDIQEWSAEYKWDGIRSQVIIREEQLFTWTRGEELVTDRYPEFEQFIGLIPDGTVFDGEILAYDNGEIGDFNLLQTRIGRKNITAALLKKVPVILKVYDLLEWRGEDIRRLPFSERRNLMENLLKSPEIVEARENGLPLQLSETLPLDSWEAVAEARKHSREMKSEGLMLKHKHSPYLVGRKKGDWWKWKVDPLTVDAVLTYAMRGHGRRSNLFTDYTFALWDENEEGERELVTFAKAYSGLTDAEFRKVDAWIKRNTLERFGPVRSVTPHHVFEIAFEGIARSSRHKSGVATRFPRIFRWRKDKKIEEANTLDDLKNLIP
ncbi:ATP-dependent DNA ligase [Zeaxanthinibacter sp. PT1]|uniref:ATP-dependent DNA ligase n=1 Tax=Zeaxanthinibacter TaxID=561554 RepID=UPI0023496AC5|nr:ATP-dependent DNA ligase [Zeaxanthinibacter sp. PT1]MDC6350330.1 ATP-dependent DNA ligase [Zeaxanthinibacter sp. PT1]